MFYTQIIPIWADGLSSSVILLLPATFIKLKSQLWGKIDPISGPSPETIPKSYLHMFSSRWKIIPEKLNSSIKREGRNDLFWEK